MQTRLEDVTKKLSEYVFVLYRTILHYLIIMRLFFILKEHECQFIYLFLRGDGNTLPHSPFLPQKDKAQALQINQEWQIKATLASNQAISHENLSRNSRFPCLCWKQERRQCPIGIPVHDGFPVSCISGFDFAFLRHQ